MNVKKLLTGGIVASIIFFLLGWLLYGMLFMDFMKGHSGIAGDLSRPEPDFLYLIIGNLAMGFLLTYILLRSGINSFAGGMITGAILGLLMAVGYDCMVYATTTIMSRTGMVADVIIATLMTAIAGGIIGIILGAGKTIPA